MNWKNVLAGGILGGILLFAIMSLSSIIALRIAPFDIFAIGGMRAMNDPIMLLYYISPFVLSFATAAVFDVVHGALKGTMARRGICFGLLLLLANTVPTLFVIFSSMTYPAGFYVANIIAAGIGFPLIGILYAYLWQRGKIPLDQSI
jgi:hypothetical protein